MEKVESTAKERERKPGNHHSNDHGSSISFKYLCFSIAPRSSSSLGARCFLMENECDGCRYLNNDVNTRHFNIVFKSLFREILHNFHHLLLGIFR